MRLGVFVWGYLVSKFEGCFLFIDFLYKLDKNIKGIFMIFLDDMKLRGLKNMLGDRIRFYKGFDRLEKWVKFS